jgi:hypothetical protein
METSFQTDSNNPKLPWGVAAWVHDRHHTTTASPRRAQIVAYWGEFLRQYPAVEFDIMWEDSKRRCWPGLWEAFAMIKIFLHAPKHEKIKELSEIIRVATCSIYALARTSQGC